MLQIRIFNIKYFWLSFNFIQCLKYVSIVLLPFSTQKATHEKVRASWHYDGAYFILLQHSEFTHR